MAYKIVVIPGDGIGKEITDAAVKVLQAADKKFGLDLQYTYKDAGGTAYDKYGKPLPEETLAACREADAVLFGAVGGDKWDHVDPALRPEKAILGLRKGLGLYANLRPVRIEEALVDYSPLKPELARGVDLVIVRELVGGIYFGDRCESETYHGVERAWDLENYSVPEVERITKLAFETARLRRGRVTSVDKANVLATSRLWRRTTEKVHAGYPEVELQHLYVDNCAMQLAIHPAQFDVIVTGNLFGDILSDEAAVVGGSIGMLPSASIGEQTSLYEPIHGSAPDIAGQGIANPMGTILSAAMLLRYSLHEVEAADAIEAAVRQTLADGVRTADLWKEGFRKVSTDEAASAVAECV
ncbi:MAG: 3-isopropylmalate dehydrogenase [Selenomonas sp.]|jgi:3-isopropylmalate dehydrogenase|nr:3-isopropylmalate dehydrogenase [Selenomonas sp.]MCI7331441.1 3-isopropylmalate dehydrogenase [Selenomonadaceae bacterium]MDD6120284.1 3-isopropylmalate dehydrogenase [Selenomonadaceae bacterium]MDD7056382.1 3-isopropylmalate dehydrogenase [Selenomonadaceae bacterium]MDY3916271.1 3-isopropylmalate dehydrogenase [Selenomonadaceae bacterium]